MFTSQAFAVNVSGTASFMHAPIHQSNAVVNVKSLGGKQITTDVLEGSSQNESAVGVCFSYVRGLLAFCRGFLYLPRFV